MHSGPSMTLYLWLRTWSGCGWCGWTAAIHLKGNVLAPFPGHWGLFWAQHLLNINHWNLPFVMLFVSQPCWIKQGTAMRLHEFDRINRYPASGRINRYMDIYFKWKPKTCCCYWVFLFLNAPSSRSLGIRETQQLRPRGDLRHWSSSLILQMSKDFLSLDCVISLRSLAHHFPSSWCSWWEPEKILWEYHTLTIYQVVSEMMSVLYSLLANPSINHPSNNNSKNPFK